MPRNGCTTMTAKLAAVESRRVREVGAGPPLHHITGSLMQVSIDSVATSKIYPQYGLLLTNFSPTSNAWRAMAMTPRQGA